MALPRVSPDLPPAQNFERFEAAFEAIDNFAGSVANLQTNLNEETEAREAFDDAIEQRRKDGDRDEAKARQDGDRDEAKARQDGDLATLVALSYAAYPGLAPQAFSNTSVGSIGPLNPLDPASVIAHQFGPAWRIAGEGTVAPRVATIFDPDAIQIVQARYWRTDDVFDPNNNAVDFGIVWLDATGKGLSSTLLHRDQSLMAQDGPRTLTFRVPSTDGDPLPIIAPKGAVAWRPYLFCFGANGATAIGTLSVRDATFASVYAPDLSGLAGAVRQIQAQLDAGLPLTTPILPSRMVADLPKPGNRGRKFFATDGRAPNAAGALEGPNAGTGVEVTDNGVAWVISGTNQQVQA